MQYRSHALFWVNDFVIVEFFDAIQLIVIDEYNVVIIDLKNLHFVRAFGVHLLQEP